VLPVGDVLAEREFYEQLGFTRYVDPDEDYPEAEFAALESGSTIRFGVSVVCSGSIASPPRTASPSGSRKPRLPTIARELARAPADAV